MLSPAELTGSASQDPDGVFKTYLWTKIVGPAIYSFINPALVETHVSPDNNIEFYQWVQISGKEVINLVASAVDTGKWKQKTETENRKRVGKRQKEQPVVRRET